LISLKIKTKVFFQILSIQKNVIIEYSFQLFRQKFSLKLLPESLFTFNLFRVERFLICIPYKDKEP